MSVGASQPWTAVVKLATQGRSATLDPQPLLEYFRPLLLWLHQQNRDEPIIGWSITSSDSGGILLDKYYLLLCVLSMDSILKRAQ